MDGEWRNIETIFGFYYEINVGHDSVDGLMARARGNQHYIGMICFLSGTRLEL